MIPEIMKVKLLELEYTPERLRAQIERNRQKANDHAGVVRSGCQGGWNSREIRYHDDRYLQFMCAVAIGEEALEWLIRLKGESANVASATISKAMGDQA